MENIKNCKEVEVSYLAVLDFFPNPIWRANTTGECDYFNKNWLEFTGRTMSQEMGYGWTEGVHKDDLDRCVVAYKKHFEKREPFLLEYRLKHKDGTYHWILDYGNPFFDKENNFIGYIGSCYDEHDNKILLEKLSKGNEELGAMNKFMIGRELKMVELKKEIEELKEKIEKLQN